MYREVFKYVKKINDMIHELILKSVLQAYVLKCLISKILGFKTLLLYRFFIIIYYLKILLPILLKFGNVVYRDSRLI